MEIDDELILNDFRKKKMMDILQRNVQTGKQIPPDVVEIRSIDHFNELVNDYKENLIIIDFWAPWCGPCRSFAPIFHALQQQYQEKGIIFTKLNVDELSEIAEQFQVSGVPSTIFIKNKKIIDYKVGLIPQHQFQSILDSLLKK